jgi:RNA polymerase sigma-70 factor, ECF subfamily
MAGSRREEFPLGFRAWPDLRTCDAARLMLFAQKHQPPSGVLEDAVAARTNEVGFLGWVDKLARRHSRALGRLAAREGLATEDALDAVQEAFATFVRLPQARGLSEREDEALALLSAVVRNAARNIRRRQRAREHAPLDETSLAENSTPVDELIALAEAHVAVLGCAQQLTKVQQHVVKLRMIEELAASEVAGILGLSASHVAVLLHRAKAELRRCLSE